MRTVFVILAASIMLLGLLAGCNKASTESDTTSVVADSSSHSAQTSSGSDAAAAPPPASATSSDSSAAGTGNSAGSGTKSAQVSPVDLSGKWIALFGRTEGGSTLDEAWKNGEIIEFTRDGGILWTKKVGSSPLDYSFELAGLTMTIKPGPKNIGRDDEVGLMNVGRDDEVGLLNVGRDDEVGLLDKKAGGKEAVGKGVLKKTLFRDGNFLAVMGEQNDIMVYGRYNGDQPMPEILGNYTGNIASSGVMPIKFEWKENYLLGTFDGMAGVFKAQYAHGYFVGVTNNNVAGSGLAAVTRLPDGTLDGIFLPMPFSSMNANFDFTPGQ